MRIGLVLSGGMAKGAFQVGALKALSNFIPKEDVTCISCASIGVLNGYSYATGKLDAAEHMWKEVCIEDNRLFISQILRSNMLQNDIKHLYKETDRLDSDLFISLLNYTNLKLVYKNIAKVEREQIPQYLRASVAMPVYNPSVKIGPYTYYDGAMIDNIPVFPLTKQKLDYIICIYFDNYSYRFENQSFDSRIIHVTFPNSTFIKQSLVFTKENISHMITKGYDHTSFLLSGIIGPDYTDIARIRKGISYRNSDTKIRITGDVLVTNFNKFSQKLIRKDVR